MTIKFKESTDKAKRSLNALIVGTGPLGVSAMREYFRDSEIKLLFHNTVTGCKVDCVINVDFAPLSDEEKFVLQTRNPMLYNSMNGDVYVTCPKCYDKSVLYNRDKVTGDISVYCKACSDELEAAKSDEDERLINADEMIARMVKSGYFYHGKMYNSFGDALFESRVIEVENRYSKAKRTFRYAPGTTLPSMYESFETVVKAAYEFSIAKTFPEPI